MNPLNTSQEQLFDAAHHLSTNWNSAKELWNDSARHRFENDFWQEFEATTTDSIEKLHDLIETINQAEREVL